MDGMTISAMRENHLDAVVTIEEDVFPDAWTRNMFFQDMHAAYAHCYVALQNDAVIGYVNSWCVCDECTINRFAFSKKNQRCGNGSRLLRHLIREALCRGVKTFFLEVRASNTAAVRFYENAGFVKTGLRKSYYTDAREDAVLMTMNPFANQQASHHDA
jgi:ribosomal-protein-alanine N-acetyltransferase